MAISETIPLALPATLSYYVTSNPGQQSLLLSLGWEMITIQGAMAVLVGWDGNHRCGVAMTICYRLCDMFIYGMA